MQQFLPSSVLRQFKTYLKIQSRMREIYSTALIFGQYLKSTLSEYIDFTVEINEVCVNFEDDLIKSDLYSSGICDDLLPFSNLLREFCMNIREMAEINLENLRWTKKQQAELYLQRFKSKLDHFLKRFKKYCNEVDTVATKVFKPYNDAVKSLDNSLKQLQSIDNPLIFYNMEANKQFSKSLDAKYRLATQCQTSFKNSLQLLKEGKKAVQVDMGETRSAATECLTFQMGVIIKIIRHIVENRTWKGIGRKATIKDSLIEQQCASQLAKLNSRYGSQGKKKRFHLQEGASQNSFQNPFKDDIEVSKIDVDQRFFYERCSNYLRMKCNSSKCSNSFREKFRNLLQCLSLKIKYHQQKYEKASKTPFGANKIQKYKKDLRKHFGPRISELFDILIEVIDRPSKTFNKMNKAINLRIDRIDKFVQDQQSNFNTFEEQIKIVLRQHKRIKSLVQQQTKTVKGDLFEQFKQSISLTFLNIKTLVSKFQKSEASIHDRFLHQVSSIVDVIQRQCCKNIYADLKKLAEDKRLTATIDEQVAKAMIQDVKYSVMYDPFYGNAIQNDFRSRIDTQTFMMTNKVLALKEDLSTKQPRSNFNGICCAGAKTPQRSIFDCQVVDGKQLRKGELEIMSEGIKFTSQGGLFSSKMVLMIPKSDITNCQVKQEVTPMYFNAIVVNTEMGDIQFAGFDKLKEVNDMIIGRFHLKKDNNTVRYSANVYNDDSSSFLKDLSRNQTPNTEIRKVYRMSNEHKDAQMARIGSSITIKAVPTQLQLHSLIQEWFLKHNFFDKQVFTDVKHQSTENQIFCVYNGILAGVKVTMKEKKQVQRSQEPPSLTFTYDWKINFKENPSIHSFVQNLKILVEMKGKAVHIKTSKPQQTQTNSYLNAKFLEQVQRMVCSFSKFVALHFRGAYEIFLDPATLPYNKNIFKQNALESVPSLHNEQTPILDSISMSPSIYPRNSDKMNMYRSNAELTLQRNSSQQQFGRQSLAPISKSQAVLTIPSPQKFQPLIDIATNHSVEIIEEPIREKPFYWKKSNTIIILFTIILFAIFFLLIRK